MNIKQLVEESHKIAKEKGWWDGPTAPNFPEKLMLIVSECSEALEDYRDGKSLIETTRDEKGKPCGVPSELADVVIRVADLCGYYGIDLAKAVSEKIEYNKSRPRRHGGKVC